MIKIYLTNLGKYNEGFLIGEWVDLPVSEEELEKVLERIGISEEPDENGNYYEEYFISDYETDINGLTIDEYEDLETLNTFAGVAEDKEEEAAALLYYGYKMEDVEEELENVIYVCTPGACETEEEAVGYFYIHDLGSLEVPDYLESYFDYERYGRDLMIEGSFYTAESGAIYEVIR